MNENKMNVQVQEREDEIQIDIVELLYYFYSKLALIVGGFLIGALIAGLVTFFCITPKYTAETTMYTVSASNNSVVDLTDLSVGSSLSQDYVELIKIRPVYEEVIHQLNLNMTPDELEKTISVSNITDTRILVISVTTEDPQLSADIANAVAEVSKEKISKLMETTEPNIAETAEVPKTKSSPSLTKNTLMGGVAVAFVIVAILTILFVTDNTLNSADDVEKAFGIMPLTVIPESDIGSLNEDIKVEESSRKHRRHRKKKKGQGDK